jgi:hypothetical protein
MPISWLLLSSTLLLPVAPQTRAVVFAGFVTIGGTVLAGSCLAFLVSVLAFVAPYGGVCLRTASSISRSMFGYAGWARFTARQRSSAAP